jgi:hypothetical protein
MHSSDEDIELCSVDRFGSINKNNQQKTKIIKKFEKILGEVRRDKIRFDSKFNLSSKVSLYFGLH